MVTTRTARAAAPVLDPLVVRHLDTVARPGVRAPEAADVGFRGVVRVGRVRVPLRAVGTVEPRRGHVLRARVLGVNLVEEQHGDGPVRRTVPGRPTVEDDDLAAVRRARTRRALAALWAPGALRPEAGASWERLDPTHLRVVADDLDLRLDVDARGHVLGVRTRGWGDPYGIGRSRWAEIGCEVRAWCTVGGVRVPGAVVVAWFPGTSYARGLAHLRLTAWEPRVATRLR